MAPSPSSSIASSRVRCTAAVKASTAIIAAADEGSVLLEFLLELDVDTSAPSAAPPATGAAPCKGLLEELFPESDELLELLGTIPLKG